MVYNGEFGDNTSIWLLDIGTSNHMTRKIKELFYHLDKSVKQKVRLGDDKEVDVLGRDSVAVLVHGGVKLSHGIQFVPSLAHNLLGVGQQIENGYNVKFRRSSCQIGNITNGVFFITIQKRNNLFEVEFSRSEQINMVLKGEELTDLWHRRYGHLNVQDLQYLSQYNMVLGLPEI